MMNLYVLCLLLCLFQTPVFAAVVYQNFEPDNGTPPSYQAPAGSPAEYGWGFNGAVVGLTSGDEPVQQGKQSWKAIVPAGPPVNAGTTIPAQANTYNVNFIPECHDRLTYWVWSDPSNVGDHTGMVKFFDQGKYKTEGIGIWTTEKAVYHQWTQLTILFSQLPADFNLHRVDKIEFFEYFDGTYYYDDVRLASAGTPEQDAACLKKENFVSCVGLDHPGLAMAGTQDASKALSPVLGVAGPGQACTSLYGMSTGSTLQFMETRLASRKDGMDLIERSAYGRL